ncbi:MAG: DUF4129 domain-containing protein [Anaerolineae bacterium]|nr:DUF4129 domain-containing protein [Thermoflexales bacterium]MDW8406165.1 DUF4129 domain-containing protein [Anaerolineae bacterium]
MRQVVLWILTFALNWLLLCPARPALASYFAPAVPIRAQESDNPPSEEAALQSLKAILDDPALQKPISTPATQRDEHEAQVDLQLPRIGVEAIRFALALAGGAGILALIIALGPALFQSLVVRRTKLARPGAPTFDEATTSAEAVTRAQHASALQDYRLAVRLLYLACLLRLDERGALRYDRTQTNREYVRQIADRPALAEALRQVVEVFDDVWYGFRPITPQGYQAFEQHVRQLLDLTQPGAQPTTSNT